MQIITLAGKEFEAGFLQDTALWTEEVGEDLAAAEGIESLNEDHWKVIRLLREYHGKFNVAPNRGLVWRYPCFRGDCCNFANSDNSWNRGRRNPKR